MKDLHANYDKLNPTERKYVDGAFSREFFREAERELGFPLRGDDEAEKAIDAVSAWIIASRPSGQ